MGIHIYKYIHNLYIYIYISVFYIYKGGGKAPTNHQLATDQTDHNHDDFLRHSCHTTTVLALPLPEKMSPVVSSTRINH